MSIDRKSPAAPQYTFEEISRQPILWPTTLSNVRSASERLQLPAKLKNARVLLTGAGTSAYAASAVASAWPRAIAVPTTDLLLDAERYLLDVMPSSPWPVPATALKAPPWSSVCAPSVPRFCSWPSSAMKTAPCPAQISTDSFPLDPRTNDKSLVMTSSFSNLVLGGMILAPA